MPPVSRFAKHQPVHVFDTPWGPEKRGDVTFTVNLSNQVVLGYFDPAKSVTFPLTYPAGVPLQYRYQIIGSYEFSGDYA